MQGATMETEAETFQNQSDQLQNGQEHGNGYSPGESYLRERQNVTVTLLNTSVGNAFGDRLLRMVASTCVFFAFLRLNGSVENAL